MGGKRTVTYLYTSILVFFLCFSSLCKTAQSEPIKDGVPDDFDHAAGITEKWEVCIDTAARIAIENESDVFKAAETAYYVCNEFENLTLTRLRAINKESTANNFDIKIKVMKRYSVTSVNRANKIKIASDDIKIYSFHLALAALRASGTLENTMDNRELVHTLSVKFCEKEEGIARKSLLTMLSEKEVDKLLSYEKKINKELLNDPKVWGGSR